MRVVRVGAYSNCRFGTLQTDRLISRIGVTARTRFIPEQFRNTNDIYSILDIGIAYLNEGYVHSNEVAACACVSQ